MMTSARTAAIVAALAAVSASAAQAAPEQPVARYAPKGYPGLRRTGVSQVDALQYLYVAVRQAMNPHSAGAGATVLQADPAVGVGDFHSLAEIAVESGDAQQIVELGWTIDVQVNGDLQPHVFSFHWVDGQETCYNGCGFVQVSPDKRPGMRIVPGEAHRYEIKLVNGDWWLLYDGEAMGYYPQSEFKSGFTQATLVQWFGEVAAATASPCTQMGNGKIGSDAASAGFDDLHVFDAGGGSVAAAAQLATVTNSTLYGAGRTTPTSFGFGGPGATSGCCTPSTCQAQQAECGAIADPVCAGNSLNCGTCGSDVCGADHTCPSGVGPRDTGEQFDTPPTDRAGGGCCDAGAGGSGALALGALVALIVRRRRRQQR
jgi:uncharacterized protein (TIGR03382 family)